MDAKQVYLNELFILLCESYKYVKNECTIPREKENIIQGFMMAGRCFQISTEEMEATIDKANMKVFGMDYKTRKKLYKKTDVSREKYFELPTFIRNKNKTKM